MLRCFPSSMLSLLGLIVVIRVSGAMSTLQVEQMIERVRSCNNIPAFALAVVKDKPSPAPAHQERSSWNWMQSDMFYTKGYGINDLDTYSKTTNETLFCVGSITKHVTALLLLHLMQLLSDHGFNYTVSSLLTDIDSSLDLVGSELKDATVEDILSHRTGLAEVFGPFMVGYSRNLSRHQLALIAAQLPRIRRNRESYFYNNHVFSIAGHLCEVLGEKYFKAAISWEALLHELFFRPLGISSNVISAEQVDFGDKLAKPYLSKRGHLKGLDRKVLQLIQPAGPAGSLCFSSSAMVTWMQFLLNRGNHQGRQIVNASKVQETWQTRICQADINGANNGMNEGAKHSEGLLVNSRTGYALGWGKNTYRGYNYVSHGGFFYSYLSLLTIFPQVNISIYTTSNGPATPTVKAIMRNLHLTLFDQLMTFPPAGWPLCPAIEKVNHYDPSALEIMVRVSDYVGVFHHDLYGTLTISSVNGSMQLRIGRFGNAAVRCWTSALECQMEFHGILWWISGSDAYKDDKDTDRRVIFQKSGHRVTRVLLPFYSPDAPPVFTKVQESSSDQVPIGVNVPAFVSTGIVKSSPVKYFFIFYLLRRF